MAKCFGAFQMTNPTITKVGKHYLCEGDGWSSEEF